MRCDADGNGLAAATISRRRGIRRPDGGARRSRVVAPLSFPFVRRYVRIPVPLSCTGIRIRDVARQDTILLLHD